jgi:hypothetical protein
MEKIREVQVPSVMTVSEDGECIRNLEELKKTNESDLVDVTVGTETKVFVQED